MYIRDMPETQQRGTSSDAVRVGYNYYPPRLLTISSLVHLQRLGQALLL